MRYKPLKISLLCISVIYCAIFFFFIHLIFQYIFNELTNNIYIYIQVYYIYDLKCMRYSPRAHFISLLVVRFYRFLTSLLGCQHFAKSLQRGLCLPAMSAFPLLIDKAHQTGFHFITQAQSHLRGECYAGNLPCCLGFRECCPTIWVTNIAARRTKLEPVQVKTNLIHRFLESNLACSSLNLCASRSI